MELLVSMLLSAVALTIVVRDFSFVVHSRADMDIFADTQQAADASLTFLTQELRQAGACLPELGNFISLGGRDGGTRDTISLRIGIADNITLQCNRTILVQQANLGESTMTVETGNGFEVDSWLYLINAAGHGGIFRIASVAGTSITLDSPFDVNYGSGSGVYAFEERRYEILEVDGVPILTVATNGDEPEPLVRGIEELDIQYRMEPCPPCTPTDEPTSDSEWRIVREVDISVVAKSSRPSQDGTYRRIENHSTIKPRNLL